MTKSDKDRSIHGKEQNMNKGGRSRRICQLNDRFRKTGRGGRLLITPGIQDMGLLETMIIRQLVADYDAFCEDNDPYGEHDFGALTYQGQKVFWKIDYYNKTLTGGSPDPADAAATMRVMTLMLASEY